MTVFFGRIKQGTDVTFPTINVEQGGNPVDLSVAGYTVECLFKTDTESAVFVEPSIATGPLADGEVVLSVSSAQTVDMQAVSWYGDVKVTDPDDKVYKSETFTFLVEADVTP